MQSAGHKHLLQSACMSTVISNCGNVSAEDIEALCYPERKRRKRTLPKLPEDLVMEIILRLPVKSLIRFRSVCKHWYKLIRSPKFITTHYETTSPKNKLSMFYSSYDDGFVSFRFFDVPVTLAIPPESQPRLVGCDNGLVCLCLKHDEFLLWNPATAQSRIIPRIRGFIILAQNYSGLCFDSAANTHKILRISFSPKDNGKSRLIRGSFSVNITLPKGKVHVRAYVYTLNQDYWREETLFAPCRFPNGGNMSEVAHLMKFMFWMVSGDKDKYILCLDMVGLEFKLIELPSTDHIHRDTQLVDYKGSLAMFVLEKPAAAIDPPPRHCCFDMWVLNDCGGTNQSWCKQLTLRPPMSDVHRPLGFFTKGDDDFVILAMSNPDRYLLWDRDTDETNNVIFSNTRPRPSFLYSESLASVYC